MRYVVDDEFGIGDLGEALREDDGQRVLKAINGRHGVERWAELRPDLVISDLMMPVMDGAGLLRAMRDNPERADIPFVLMCALPEHSISERISGYDAFVRKPFKLAEISALVSQMLSRAK